MAQSWAQIVWVRQQLQVSYKAGPRSRWSLSTEKISGRKCMKICFNALFTFPVLIYNELWCTSCLSDSDFAGETYKNTKPCHWVPNNANLIMQSCNQDALNLIPAFISSCLTVTDWLPLRPSIVAFSYISDFFWTVCSSTLKSSGRELMSSPEARLKPQNLLLNMENVENGELVYFRHGKVIF